MCAACYAHLILLDLINIAIVGEVYKLFSSSLLSLLYSPSTSSLCQMFSSPHCSQTRTSLNTNIKSILHMIINIVIVY